MLGPIIIVLVLVLIPVVVMMSGAIAAGAIGFFLKKDVDQQNEGTEYLDLA